MKSVHNDFLTKDSREKLASARGTSKQKTTYTREDYLTPGKVGEMLGVSTDKAKEIMKKFLFKRASFIVNGHKAPVVVRFNRNDNVIYLHPMATEILKKYMEQQKG